MTVNDLDLLIKSLNIDMEIRIVGKDCETGRLFTSGIKTYTIECPTPHSKRVLLLNPDDSTGIFFSGRSVGRDT